MSGTLPILGPISSSRWRWVWLRNLRVWRRLAIASLMGHFGEPVLYLLALGYGLGALVGRVEEMPYVVYLASGIVCSSTMMTASMEATYSAYTRMAVQRTWDAMVTTPLEVGDVVLGEVAWAASKGVLSAACILIVAGLLGAVHGWGALWALPVALLTGLCFAGMAMVITAVSRSYEFFLYYTTLLVTPMLLLSGVFFPLAEMPDAIQGLAGVLPLTHAVAVVRPLMTGSTPQDTLAHLGVIALYTAITVSAAIWLIRRRLTA